MLNPWGSTTKLGEPYLVKKRQRGLGEAEDKEGEVAAPVVVV